jgi:RecA-family ATPase
MGSNTLEKVDTSQSEDQQIGSIIIPPLEDNFKETKIMNGMDLINRDIEEIPTLLDPVFAKVGTVAFAGTSDIGKSTILRQFALAVAMGDSEFLGWKLNTEHKNVLVVSTEDFKDSLTIALKRFNRSRNKPKEAYKGINFITDIEDLHSKVENYVRDNPIDVLILDAYLDIYSGTNAKNDGGQVRQFLTKYDQLANKYNFLAVWNHHTKKGSQAFSPDKDNVLGSQSFEAKMRLVCVVRPDLVDDDKRHLCFVKANYLAPEYKIESYVIRHDENLYFKATGERELFENLRVEVKAKQDLKKLVEELSEEGMTAREIETKLRSEGYKISKSSVHRILKEEK